MAKALMGHLGGPDPRVLAELAALRRRVGELELEVLRLRADALVDVSDEALGALESGPVLVDSARV